MIEEMIQRRSVKIPKWNGYI